MKKLLIALFCLTLTCVAQQPTTPTQNPNAPKLTDKQKVEFTQLQKGYSDLLLQLVQTPLWQQKSQFEGAMQNKALEYCASKDKTTYKLNPDTLECVAVVDPPKK